MHVGDPNLRDGTAHVSAEDHRRRPEAQGPANRRCKAAKGFNTGQRTEVAQEHAIRRRRADRDEAVLDAIVRLRAEDINGRTQLP